MVETFPYDPSETLRSAEAVMLFLRDAFESKDSGYIAHAIGIAARSAGMTEIARRTGLAREALYRSFTDNGNPSLTTLMAVLDALDLKLSVDTRKTSGKTASAHGTPLKA